MDQNENNFNQKLIHNDNDIDYYKHSLRFKGSQFVVWLITFMGYASFHACRQAFADATNLMEDQWDGFSKVFCGTMDGIFLFVYAFGLFMGGYIGDKFDAKKVHSFGLLMMSLIYFVFASCIPYFNFNSKIFFVFLWVLNGLVQSLGWPTAVKIMANWFDGAHDGIIFGLWAGCQYVGNIIGSGYCSYVSAYNLSIQWNFYLPAAQAFIISILCFLFVSTYPPHSKPTSNVININDDLTKDNDIKQQKESVGILGAIVLPNVVPYGCIYACLKGVNYTLFWWLPYFLDPTFGDSKSDDLSMFFNIGQIFGGTICGFISDQFSRRSPSMMLFLILAFPPLFMLHINSSSYAFFIILTSLAGFFIGGPANFIPSIVAAEVGKMEAAKNNPASLATITGLIDGMGSVGAAICVYGTTFISNYGDGLVFIILSCLIILGAILMSPLALRDFRYIMKQRNGNNNVDDQYKESLDIAVQTEPPQ